MPNVSPDNFEAVFAAELEEIAKRQGTSDGREVDRKELAGLALSGGGIRSATTSLGVLQALRKLNLLGVFDYLSTVSGGGFAGSWWSAWTSRPFDDATKDEKFFPPRELTQPERDAMHRSATIDARKKRWIMDPAHHLRLFSNYLTPVKGALSSDTWRATAVISRNLVLTWLVLVPMLFAAVLLAQSYFTMQPGAETEFLYPYSHFADDNARTESIKLQSLLVSKLDSIVHGNRRAESLAPIQELKEFGNSIAPAAAASGIPPVLAIVKGIDSVRRIDSAASADLGDTATFATLDKDLVLAQQGLLEWYRSDSAMNALAPTLTHVRFRHALDSNNMAHEARLDILADSIHRYLTSLKRRMIDHREDELDRWLFNKQHATYLANRAVWASYLPSMMIAWIVMLICLWMLNSSDRMFGGNILQGSYAFISGLVAFNAIKWVIPNLVHTSARYSEWNLTSLTLPEVTWSVVALLLLNALLWDEAHWFWKAHKKSMTNALQEQLSKLLEVRRSRIVTVHQRLLLGVVLVTVLLLFGGFGHEVINYLLFFHSERSSDLWQWTARFGSLAAIVSALMGTGLAARSSTLRSDREVQKPNKFKNFFIALAPPVILLLLLCSVSWCSHWVIQDLILQQSVANNDHYLLLIFSMWMLGFLSLYYVIYDLHFRSSRKKTSGSRQFTRSLLALVVVLQAGIMMLAVALPSAAFHFSVVWALLPAALWAVVGWKYLQEQKAAEQPDHVARSNEAAEPANKEYKRRRSFLGGIFSSLFILASTSVLLILIMSFIEVAKLPVDHLFLAALGTTLLLFVIELVWGIRAPRPGRRGNHEARILLGINVTLYTLFLMIPPLAADSHWGVTHVLEILIALAIGLVIFVGWRIDPNALSIHTFYKNRLVRAYLGASNAERSRSSVSEVHPEDDIPLSKLTTCENGAPYHLINTTLNLLGTKTLEAAQRHASNFIFSKRYCGSVTTGYRPTDEYMSGAMTLGTAVAISGAAASPNMGSNQVSGATTMLMSLLNVRLGYWAANPGRARWREAQPKLWPYYLVRESLSQTSGFGTFCYLTDGGHFDNTGLYPLIERGCRYIVLCDNGADPQAQFKDLGNALRRCRIDFGVEFELDGLKNQTRIGRRGSGSHWLRGTVRYAEAHLRLLWGEHWDEGLSEDEKQRYREGTILVLKPAFLGDEPADVLQYGLEFSEFPQQSTANQWFSEDQFESYRRLGYWSVQTAFSKADYGNVARREQLEAIAETPAEMATDVIQPMTGLAYGATLENV